MTDGRVAAVAQQPAYLHMHDAMQLLTLSSQYWLENDAQLRQALEAAPADPRLMVLLANNRMTTSLLNPAAGALQPELLRAAEKESETLVLAAVENLQDQPNYLLAAARVLLMLGSGWLELAESLVDRAFQTGTSFAAVFALRAQIHAARGETAQALEMYDRALEMSLPQSEFRVYLLVLKICALLASGNYKAVQRLTPELYREKPLTRMQLGVQLTPPDATLDADLQHLLAGIGVLNAAVMTRHAYYMGARRMLHPEHRENMMRGLIQRVIRQYGTSAIPEDIRAALPGLIGE
jgi:tetratricopeptide (TPR) repeat protein